MAARAGIWTPEQYRDRLATIAASDSYRPGRTWRNIEDTARMAQVLYNVNLPYDNWRLTTDFYDEGELLWLDVDTTIRKMSNGGRTLNDFLVAFHGLGGNTGPKVVAYSFDDVVAGLNGVVANDWATFLRSRLQSHRAEPPLGGLENGGYKLVFTETPNSWATMDDADSGNTNFWYSLGLEFFSQGILGDVLIHGPADRAGFGPGMKVIAVNGREYSPDVLHAAVVSAKGTKEPIEFIVENTGFFKVLKIDYHGGERYPALERVANTPDRLDDILAPMVK